MPPEILAACRSGNLVIFAGAGTSTEAATVLPVTLYSQIHEALELPGDDASTFPRMMQRYEDRHGRSALLKQIKQRLDYVRSFPELERRASQFARALASLFPVTDIFTTNWDDYFERHCAATPFLTEQDWALWRDGDRKVFKLHGSISAPGSVVATDADYKRCYREMNKGLIGATLKTMLATKTVVFVGYSFGDADFNAVYGLLKRRMKDILPRAYIVSLDERDPPNPVSRLHVIRTDATYFVEQLKNALPDSEFIPDSRLEVAGYMASIVMAAHEQMLERHPLTEHPETAIAAMYQDGLIHAFEHQHANRTRGDYSHTCHVKAMIATYEELRVERLRHRHYGEVAYVDGFLAGLRFLLQSDDEREGLSLYQLFGHAGRLQRLDEFVAASQNAHALHKAAYREAERIASAHAPYGTVPHHLPMLLPIEPVELIDPPTRA
jgi:hypothetical protein